MASVTQWFGENPAFYAQWGYRGHNGLDIGLNFQNVYAETAGTVEFVGDGLSYGNLIIIRADDGTKHYYAHLQTFYVGVGNRVNRSDVIAISGNTGLVTGPHLHYGIKGSDVNNGYAGYIDPVEYLNNIKEQEMSSEQYIRDLYQALLYREADGGGLAYHQTLDPISAFNSIYNSPEAVNVRNERQTLISRAKDLSIHLNDLTEDLAVIEKRLNDSIAVSTDLSSKLADRDSLLSARDAEIASLKNEILRLQTANSIPAEVKPVEVVTPPAPTKPEKFIIRLLDLITKLLARRKK